MQFEGRRRSSQVPGLTPLIDIVFLLLVFFMLTSHFVREEALEIDLPKAESGAGIDDNQPVEVVLDGRGRILVAGERVGHGELEEALRRTLSGREDRSVRIRGDRDASLGGTVAILDAARAAGATGVDLVTERP